MTLTLEPISTSIFIVICVMAMMRIMYVKGYKDAKKDFGIQEY